MAKKRDARRAEEGTPEETADREEHEHFPVIGIGASAGGLEAFREFLEATPSDTGMAFVLVQHLAPTRESLMAEILAKHTAMRCMQVEDRMAIEPNSVYVIPPNQYMEVTDLELHLTEPPGEHHVRTPIDFFFSSLAVTYGERSIGVLLSGGGTDGTAGLRDIKAHGGLTVVQDPQTAMHDSMPRHAVETGLVDKVLPVAAIPQALVDYVNHAYVKGARNALDTAPGDPLTDIIALLRARSRFDFRQYKRSTLARRVHRRMGLRQVHDAQDYLALLRKDAEEVSKLSSELLIGVSSFFRDPEAYEVLAEKVIPLIFRNKGDDTPVRVWVAGTATGEEAYSIGILLLEHKRKTSARCGIQIFATDVDESALAVARTGIYATDAVAQMSKQRLERFFSRQDEFHYRVAKELREAVVFAPQNVLSDPPFSRLDLVSCRNLMIYLTPEPQQRLLDLFYFALRRGGYLFLGPAESTTGKNELFENVSSRWRVYRAVGRTRPHALEFPLGYLYEPEGPVHTPIRRPNADREANAADLMHHTLVGEFAPACVLINEHYEVLYTHGPVERYLEWPAGEPTRNLLDVLGQRLRGRARGGIAGAAVLRRRRQGGRHPRGHPARGGTQPAGGVLPGHVRTRTDEGGSGGRGEGAGLRGPRVGGATPQHPGGPAEHDRGTGDLERGDESIQRRDHVHERGAPEHQRGDGDLEGGTPVPQ
jgi:two-component system CheB/CheR fusion protein